MHFRNALLGVALVATPAASQIDYRKLDRGRPGTVEDAYALERYGFELMAGYRLLRPGNGATGHLLESELSHGLGRGLSVSAGLPVALDDGSPSSRSGIAGLHLAAKYNLTTERPSLPGIGLRLSGDVPVGSLAGEGSAGLALLMTRSLGRSRVHVNGSAGVRECRSAGVLRCGGAEGTWEIGMAVDRTLIRSSTLLIAEVSADQDDWHAGVGIRRQLTPTVVLDAGIGFHRPSFTFGFSRAFGIAGLVPRGAR